jgi:hypothetical protein
MNLRSTTAVNTLTLSIGLLVGVPAGASAAGNSQLNGEYAGTQAVSCLAAPGGFNEELQPIDLSDSFTASGNWEGVWTFNGAGSVEVDATSVGNSAAAAAASTHTPDAYEKKASDVEKYSIAADGVITITATNFKERVSVI